MSNEVGFNLTPKTLAEAMDYAGMIAKSNICPKDMQNKPGDVLVAIQMGIEVGLQPLQSIQNIAVINGRPTLWGDAMVALVRNSGRCEYLKEWMDDKGTAWCETKRVDEDEPHKRSFSMEMARTAKLLGKQGPWTQYPDRMLAMRARGYLLRDVYADVLKGMAMREEVVDIDPPRERDITPPEVGAVAIEKKEPVSKQVIEQLRDKLKTGPKEEDVPRGTEGEDITDLFEEGAGNEPAEENTGEQPQTTEAYDKLVTKLCGATDQAKLDEAADMIRDAKLTEVETQSLRKVYASCKQSLAQ